MYLTFKYYLCFAIFICINISAFAQQTTKLKGKVVDENNNPVEAVNIGVAGSTNGTFSDKDGNYVLEIAVGKRSTVVFTFIGRETVSKEFSPENTSEINYTPQLKASATGIKTVEVIDNSIHKTTMNRIDPKLVSVMANPNGSLESILKTLPGVVSNNELSSQYSVRGGNFDENLVYVNDIEIYRPFLIRSGQQEGLSFANPDMVSSILFSAGGFDAKYGDKMASVLDLQYRRPVKTGGNVAFSLLGGSAYVQGVSKDYRFTYQMGVRQKSNSYLLNSLDTKGNYKPSFTDFQTLLSYDITENLELDFLGSYARNKFLFVPSNRETDFGTFNQALRFTVYFDGKELDTYETMTGATSLIYKPKKNLTLKLIGSAYNSNESENFDIQGQYRIDELETNFGSADFGNVKFNRGVGTFLNHARNELNANIIYVEHKAYYNVKNNYMQWGVRAQHENIEDKLSEWQLIDSSGYSIPYYPNDVVNLNNVLKSKNTTTSTRAMAYFQNRFDFSDSSIYSLTAGARLSYWDMNQQLLFSPRATFSIHPKWIEKNYFFRFSSGMYYQPPFYREMRAFDGTLNTNLKAQQSIHLVAAMDHMFKAWDRPFKVTTEMYYKFYDNLVPYEIDNVRVRYFAQNSAKGYARGIDCKVNGEFVKNVESWVSLSYMKTQEDIKNDYYYNYYNKSGERIYYGYTQDNVKIDSVKQEPGYIPRPTDQRVTFSMFFQDYIPRVPSCKMHMNLIVGTGMPFGPPDHSRFKDTLRVPPYRRVDIGFSYLLKKEEKVLRPKNPFKCFKTIWLSVDVFNLLAINNTVSYLWVKDITNRQYAIPNYLSQRLFNVRLQFSF